MKLLRNEQGLTLPELIVAMVVTSILATVLVSFVLSNLTAFSGARARIGLLASAQSALDVIAQDIRLAAGADENNRWLDDYAPNAPSDTFSWASGQNTIVLATAAETNDKEIIFSDASKYVSLKNNVIYFIQDGSLMRRVLAAPDGNNSASTTCPAASASETCPADKVITQNVSNFSIAYYGADGAEVTPVNARSIQITLELTNQAFKQKVTVDYSNRTVFRND